MCEGVKRKVGWMLIAPFPIFRGGFKVGTCITAGKRQEKMSVGG